MSTGKKVANLALVALLVAVIDALVSGGWWAVVGWTVVAVTLIALAVRVVRHAPGVQHAGVDRYEVASVPPVSRRLAYSDRP